MISRQFANQLTNKLQIIYTLMELNQIPKAKNAVQELARFLNQHVEIEEDQRGS